MVKSKLIMVKNKSNNKIKDKNKIIENASLEVQCTGRWDGSGERCDIFTDVSTAFKMVKSMASFLAVNKNTYVCLFTPHTSGVIPGLQIATLFGKNPFEAAPTSYVRIDETISDDVAYLHTSNERVKITIR